MLHGVQRRVIATIISFITLISAHGAMALGLETSAKYAYLVDLGTGTVLLTKNEDDLMSPASMSKLMTMIMVFDAIKDGSLTLDEEFHISENAWRKGGSQSGSSTMFAKLKSNIALKDLVQGVIVQSANDACIAIAEGMSGGEREFASAMTRRARVMGLERSTFTNSTGWPDPGHKMTAKELAMLAVYIIKNHPDHYNYYSQQKFTWNGITQRNRNPLLYQDMGADGLKTGHTEDSGYGLVASASRKGRRIVLVLNGMTSKKERSKEARRLMDWGFRAFQPYKLFSEGVEIGQAEVWGGIKQYVGLTANRQVNMLMPRTSQREVKVSIVYNSPLKAPVTKGDEVGMLHATAPGSNPFQTPLYATESIPSAGAVGRGWSLIRFLIPGL